MHTFPFTLCKVFSHGPSFTKWWHQKCFNLKKEKKKRDSITDNRQSNLRETKRTHKQTQQPLKYQSIGVNDSSIWIQSVVYDVMNICVDICISKRAYVDTDVPLTGMLQYGCDREKQRQLAS